MEKSEFAQQFGARVQQRRWALEISQEELARRANLAVSSVSKIDRGLMVLGMNYLVELAQALETTPNDLLGVAAQG